MKTKVITGQAVHLLFDHILDGFRASYEGIDKLMERGLITDKDKLELMKKNSERLIQRIHEFKVGQKLLALFFAALFGYMQITGDDLEMRRARRSTRTGRRREIVI